MGFCFLFSTRVQSHVPGLRQAKTDGPQSNSYWWDTLVHGPGKPLGLWEEAVCIIYWYSEHGSPHFSPPF